MPPWLSGGGTARWRFCARAPALARLFLALLSGGASQAELPYESGGRQATLALFGLELSLEDDQVNDQKIYKYFEREFFSAVQGTRCHHDEEGLQCGTTHTGFNASAWGQMMASMQSFVDHALQTPSLALGVGTSLYSWFWWEGPHSTMVNVQGAEAARVLLSASLDFSGCRDRGLPPFDFFRKNCHMRWRYLLMIASELGRHLAVEQMDLAAASGALRAAQGLFEEMRLMPVFGPHAGPLNRPHDINFNGDFFPASVAKQGPVWRNPRGDVPIAPFLEAAYPIILAELQAILAEDGLYNLMQRTTRNAEPQFGPRDDDWQTAYLVRSTGFNEPLCDYAPQTCQLLRSRPEVAECRSGIAGAGFLRLRPGGRLKPHFGNSPRLSAHLALIVPPGEIRMSVGSQTVSWVEGEVLVFDDTFIHSVTHHGLEPRYVLNVWMCHPCDPTNGRSPEAMGQELPDFCQGPEQGLLPPDAYRR